MTEEDKELLLQDLSSRLPYGVKIELTNSWGYHHENIAKKGDITIDTLRGFSGKYFTINHDNPLDWDWDDSEIEVKDIKPYLFPISSISEEQVEELRKRYVVSIIGDSITIVRHSTGYWDNDIECDSNDYIWLINWLYKNHFDVNDLIPKGLAKDATGLNIY